MEISENKKINDDAVDFIDEFDGGNDSVDEIDGGNHVYYKNNGKQLCYIINNENFAPNLKLPKRDGTNSDFKNLVQTFENLNFEVKFHKDSKKNEMLANLTKISKRADLHSFSTFVCIIMSHGDEGIVYGADEYILIENLLRIFKGDCCPALVGKPKIFIIQACRGDKFDAGVFADDIKTNNIDKIPVEADFLVGYSTVPGYFSWRNKGNGSWYIQSLCDVLKRKGETDDLVHLLVQVNNNVAKQFRSNTGQIGSDNMVQISSFVCMLRKLVTFLKF